MSRRGPGNPKGVPRWIGWRRGPGNPKGVPRWIGWRRARVAPPAAVLAVVLMALPGAATPAPAAETGQRAALIVEVGQAVRRLCVGLGRPAVSGKELVEASGLEQRWDGGALCRLAGTGPAGGDCFAQYPRFWGYWIGDGRGGWTWSGAGAATSTVRDGSLEAWVWSAGPDESSHRRPPALTFADVCAASGPAPGAAAAGTGATGGDAAAGRDAGGSAAPGGAGQAGPGAGGAGWESLAGGGAAMLAALGLVALAWRRRRRA
jgi:hypothetical protein